LNAPKRTSMHIGPIPGGVFHADQTATPVRRRVSVSPSPCRGQ